jgi:hypothetical protein
MTRSIHQSTKRAAGRQGEKTTQGKIPAKLLVAMTGKASAAKTATGDEPVFAYIASLPQPQRGIAEDIDDLAAKCLPRGVELASVNDFDERQLASWMKQAATMPFVGGKKR